MARDTNQIMGHAADNDGIEEYDNPLPDWWVGLFLVTIVGGIGYGVNYHFISHDSQAAYYDAEMADAEKLWPTPKGTEVAELTPETVAAGQEIFKANCVACHGEDMHGKIGPNLTDEIWLHGGTQEEIQSTITTGVPAKGMITWGPILGPDKIKLVAAFVYASGPKLGVHLAPGATAGQPVNVK
jgi:cytochrome c oxidase cbb3-type subunit 3